MSEPWTTTADPALPERTGSPITLVEGSTFCISGRAGDMREDLPEGLFFLDTRLLSRWQLEIDGVGPQPLAVSSDGPNGATFVSKAPQPESELAGSVLVMRRRLIGRGMREELLIRHYGLSRRSLTLTLRHDVDFADLFEVKLGGADRVPLHQRSSQGQCTQFHHSRGGVTRIVTLSFSQEPAWVGDAAVWPIELEPNEEWRCCIEVTVSSAGEPIPPRYRCGDPPEEAVPARRYEQWHRNIPTIRSDHPRLSTAIDRSLMDVGWLRMFDPAHPERPVVAAGAPWFMTLFGRDSLLTGWMSLIVDPDIALGVVEALARLQGTTDDPVTEEQPGRILHEVRFGESMSMSLGDGHLYYGTADATPLFVMLLGELARWGHEPAIVRSLIPAADRALAWIEGPGDRDGDGYVEYERLTSKGLRNQGWKDSWNGVPAADGTLPDTPIALCEVQGYVYGAYIARAALARLDQDAATEATYLSKARALRDAFQRDFWLPERGWYALGLDARKQPIDALASNIGHCLWTGIVDPDHARVLVPHLMSEGMFSGWGVRTLAASMARYDPLSYHNGSVWPHDNAILAAGLMRYGFVHEAHRIILAILDVASAHEGRLPELFSGVGRHEIDVPVTYPTSCSPQAWAAASPLLFLRSLLGLEPTAEEGWVRVQPRLPEGMERLSVEGIPLAGRRISIHVEGDGRRLDGFGEGLAVRDDAVSWIDAQPIG